MESSDDRNMAQAFGEKCKVVADKHTQIIPLVATVQFGN